MYEKIHPFCRILKVMHTKENWFWFLVSASRCIYRIGSCADWTQNVLKSAAQTQKQINLVKLHEQSKTSLEQEIQNYKEEATKQRKIIYQLEKERDRYINEASDLTQKVN